MSEKMPDARDAAPSVYCYEAGLAAGCKHDFQHAPNPTLQLPQVTPTQSLNVSTSVTVPTLLRLYCRRCGGYRLWPEESGTYRREVSR